MKEFRFAELVPVVLAAGASTRMGQPKELLTFSGVTCLELVLAACADAGLGAPILVTRKERENTLFRLLSARPSACPRPTIAVNQTPELGQTSSLRAGLAALPAGARGFLIYPVDHPLVTAADIVRLASAFNEEDADAARPLVVAPSFARRRGHPVVVDAALAPAIRALPPDGSARDVLGPAAARTRYIDFDDDRVLTDMDTPAAYESCQARLAAR